MKSILQLIRVKQWLKNVFIFLPAFFGGVLTLEGIPHLLAGFFGFSMIASVVYIINDLNDIESDKLHPKKKLRPLPSGVISKGKAMVIGAMLFIASMVISWLFLPNSFTYILLTYLIINILYSYKLKTISIVDILIVAFGFVFRVLAGAELVVIDLSFWLLLMTFLFSLFVVLAKRRDDFCITDSTPYQIRKVNKYYSLDFLNTQITIVSGLMMVCYIMYTFNSDYFKDEAFIALMSSILVIVGLMRYFQAIFIEDKGGSPTEFAFKDRFIQIVLLLWAALYIYLIYIK